MTDASRLESAEELSRRGDEGAGAKRHAEAEAGPTFVDVLAWRRLHSQVGV